MNDSLTIAMISAGSAILGGLIPLLMSFLIQRNQNRFELQRILFEEQKVVYNEVLIALQKVVSSQDPTTFLEFQRCVNRLATFGDNNSSKAINEYYIAVAKAEQGKRVHLSRNEHQHFHQEIINGMRRNLNLSELNYFEIVGFRTE